MVLSFNCRSVTCTFCIVVYISTLLPSPSPPIPPSSSLPTSHAHPFPSHPCPSAGQWRDATWQPQGNPSGAGYLPAPLPIILILIPSRERRSEVERSEALAKFRVL